ncbi:Peroxisomal membrane protein 11-4 [Platanthera zijinensis]|uniref:Peroxisomal membrane protein 11-4 n=1 Tax=Platanthera zijinensis TaxID=2320716 RepID=A0AAP0BJW2_9ASPA
MSLAEPAPALYLPLTDESSAASLLPYPKTRRSAMRPDGGDTVDKLVVFLAKRDGIDKLVKTFQYVAKLVHHRADPARPSLARRAKLWEISAGLSRKAFRVGRFLTGFNALRRLPGPTLPIRILAVLANAGEMVYFFFDHFLWLARAGVLDPSLSRRLSFVSAFGEAFGYVFFILLDLIAIRKGLIEQRRLASEKKNPAAAAEDERDRRNKEREKAIGIERVMRMMGIAANVADLIIAIADIEPNPFCNHEVTLGISGLVSAWAGWYRNWPT